MDVAVLIPAHNEANRIGATVCAALAIPNVRRVVVIDDGSDDSTGQIAGDAGAEVVTLPANRGKGAALEAGASRVADADVVLLLDADLGDTASQGELLLSLVLSGAADMAVATFPPVEGKAGFGLVKTVARWGIRRLGGRSFEPRAPLSGQRAMTGTCLAAVRPFSSGYGAEVGITIRALRTDCRVVEVDTTMSHSATGRDLSGFLHRGRQFVDVVLTIAQLAFSARPSGR